MKSILNDLKMFDSYIINFFKGIGGTLSPQLEIAKKCGQKAKILGHLVLQTELKTPSITKVMAVGVRQSEGFLYSSNFDVFKNLKSMIKSKTIKKLI